MGEKPLPTTDNEPVTGTQPAWKGLLQRPPVRILNNFLLLPLLGTVISGMIIGRVVDRLVGPRNYLVYVVGNDADPSTQELMNAAGAGEFKSRLDGVQVTTEKMTDYGDPERASSNAESLHRRSDVLMVIGPGSSTSAQRALPHYLQANPPIPVILTMETNPALYTPPARDEDRVPPVFRLFPTDDDQAQAAAKFVASQGAKSLWVVEDSSNPIYSQYLARRFLNDVYEVQPSPKVVLWSTNLNLPPYALDKLGIDWVFFAGEWWNALVLIRQLQAMQGMKTPKVLLSDGSADKHLLEYGRGELNGVYLLHPLDANVFKKQGYAAVGREAYDLASAIIDKVHEQFDELAVDGAPLGYRLRKLLGLHRVSDARRAMAHYMATAVHNQNPFTLSHSTISDSTITMTQDSHRAVIRKDALFHIWRIDQNDFTNQ